ncbi:fatty acid--CoA ligase [Bradyrhizobium sp. USDA 4486]
MAMSADSFVDRQPHSIAEAVRKHAELSPGKVAITFEDRHITYGDLHRGSNRVANGLAALGVGASDRVAIIDKNSERFFEIWVAVSKLNAVIVPVNARLAAPEVEYVVSDACAKVLFVGESFLELLDKIRVRLSSVVSIIVLNDDYEEWRQGFPVEHVGPSNSADAVSMQLYTSGTTGHPKGVLLANRNLFSTASSAVVEWGNWTADDACLVVMPLFHIAGCGFGLLSLIGGLRMVVVREFRSPQVIGLIERERATIAFFVPAMIMALLDEPGIAKADTSSLRRIIYGASPIPSKLLQRALDRFAGTGFVQTYGLTETSGGITSLSPEDHADPDHPRMKSCGRAMLGVELRVVDSSGEEVAEGTVGEVICRSARNMSGYWNREDDTARTIRDGWLHTGDAGYLDREGYLYIHDRVKDMIVSGGENIYPAEIESAMFGHPAIADVAVIGVPDERWGEAVKAIVVLKPGASDSIADILAYTRERIAGYKIPKSVEFVDVLPRNSTGKVLKRQLREKYWKGFERHVN